MTFLVACLKDKNHVKIAADVDLYLVSAGRSGAATSGIDFFFTFIFLNIDISVIIYVTELNQTFCS